MILSTSWGGELVTLVRQASERRLFERSTFVLPVAEASMQTLGRTMPAGHVIGARGDHWNNHPKPKNPEALKSFVDGYRQRFNEYPIYPCHHMAQAFSALQAAYAKAIAAKGGGWPNDQELADAFRGLTFDTPTSTITLREDGQGLEDQLVGLSQPRRPLPLRGAERHGHLPRRHGEHAGRAEERRLAEVAQARPAGAGARADRDLSGGRDRRSWGSGSPRTGCCSASRCWTGWPTPRWSSWWRWG